MMKKKVKKKKILEREITVQKLWDLGEKKVQQQRRRRRRRRIGKLMRKFVLPENANTEAISAVCQDGVLTVTVEKLPPPEPKKPKTIEVKVA